MVKNSKAKRVKISDLYTKLIKNRYISIEDIKKYLDPILLDISDENIISEVEKKLVEEDDNEWKTISCTLKSFRDFLMGKSYLLATQYLEDPTWEYQYDINGDIDNR
jgi:hypothetical protein